MCRFSRFLILAFTNINHYRELPFLSKKVDVIAASNGRTANLLIRQQYILLVIYYINTVIYNLYVQGCVLGTAVEKKYARFSWFFCWLFLHRCIACRNRSPVSIYALDGQRPGSCPWHKDEAGEAA